ncbi:MAG TPA: MFS transporter [Aggregatilineales bacterium]|nr:MFS transporter [Aggregatilineales bacterium]
MNTTATPSGMRAFSVIWVGQFLSLLGTGMTRFAITLWAWEMTGQATALALVGFFSFAPVIIMSPLAGALVDRWKRRRIVMMLSDGAAGVVTLMYIILSSTGSLELWHLYVGAAFVGTFESFQFPAYSAAITSMVDKSQYARTSAMMSLADSASGIIAPIAAAALYPLLKLNGILMIDFVTFLIALVTLLIVFIPQGNPSAHSEGRGSLLTESLYGFRYILARRSLLGLQLVFFFGNFLGSIAFTLSPAMILARTGNDEVILAAVNTAFGVGGLLGGVALSAWGGPKRRIYGVLAGWMLGAIFGQLLFGLSQSPLLWIGTGLMATLTFPLVNASNQAIWMSKIPPHLQGRVFSVRRLIAQVTSPLAMLVAGPLADFVFEPMMSQPGPISNALAPLTGMGPGVGMGLIIALSGLLTVVVVIVSYSVRAVRNVEDIIPDHVGVAPATPSA